MLLFSKNCSKIALLERRHFVLEAPKCKEAPKSYRYRNGQRGGRDARGLAGARARGGVVAFLFRTRMFIFTKRFPVTLGAGGTLAPRDSRLRKLLTLLRILMIWSSQKRF